MREQVEDLVGLRRSDANETLRKKLFMKSKEDDGFGRGEDPSTWYLDDSFETEALRSIYLGCNISDGDQQAIMDMANERYSQVGFYRSTLAAESYELEFERI